MKTEKEVSVSELIKSYTLLDKEKKEIEKSLSDIRDKVKGFMEEKKIESYKIAEGSVSYTKSKRISYDTEKLLSIFGSKKLEPAVKEIEVVSVRITPHKEK